MSGDQLRFDGRVVVVTGAGAGLGRTYALLFASRGAKVVVNDLGGGRHGDGKSSKAADDVVAEIKKAGGTAVADYNSVVEGEKVIQTALDNFGRVDVLINNAGILRDKSFARISDQDWDLIQAVHLKGAFKTSQAAFPIFKKQNYGRIINTTSNSGIYGNFGQANYSAAKAGLIGLTNTLAIEGSRNNIHCNCIAPTAASRLTEDILPPDIYNELKPELIAPVVAYLCHESCTENGSVIDSAAGWAGKVQTFRSSGALLRGSMSAGVTIENVRDNWSKVVEMGGAKHLSNIQECTLELMNSLEKLREGIGSKSTSQDSSSDETETFTYEEKDLILYALGVGASVTTEEELKFLYENHESFGPLPGYFVCPALTALYMSRLTTSAVPGKEISLERILHGEQYLEIVGDLKSSGTLHSKLSISEVLDKGSGALIVYQVDTYDEEGKLLFKNQIASFAVGSGNFGGPRSGTKLVPTAAKPTRNPDVSLQYKTSDDQAALYRLSGDFNPLHIDPNLSALGGYEKPILHGLCSFGISTRLIMGAFANYDTSLVKAIKCRFVKPVLPGQTLKVEMWRDGNRIHFETSVVETGQVCIAGAYVDLKEVKPSIRGNKMSGAGLESDAIFQFIIDKVKETPEKAKSVNGVFLYNITKDGKVVKQWTMDLKKPIVYEGPAKAGTTVQTTVTVSDADFVQMATGKLNPQAAFMKGKLKVTGNVMLAQKLGPLLQTEAKL
nr:peroxisomal multifunctional enzyme type 2-like isoform X1 [Onthophagus taurus]